MMSLMVFTISAVNACGEMRRFSSTALEAARFRPAGMIWYLDLLVYVELFVMDVLHLHHQDVGIWQRLKLRSQISF